MKRKLLCGVCIALILALSLCILAAATRMNRDTPTNPSTQTPNDTSILDGMMGNSGVPGLDENGGNNRLPAPDGNAGNGMTNDNTNNNGTNNDNNMNGNAANDGNGMTESMPMEELLPETNIPDADIGGAVGDNDSDSVPDAVDSDDDNDGVRDPADSDADGDGVNDEEKTTGIIGIILAVVVVVAVIIVIIAVVPKKPKES